MDPHRGYTTQLVADVVFEIVFVIEELKLLLIVPACATYILGHITIFSGKRVATGFVKRTYVQQVIVRCRIRGRIFRGY